MKHNRLFVILVIVIPVLLLLIVLGYHFYRTPQVMDTPAFPIKVAMTKLDAAGNTRGTCEITIEGSRLKYLSGTECLNVEITGLPAVGKIGAVELTNTGLTGEIRSYPGMFEFQEVLCEEWPDGGFIHLLFSPDFDRWALSRSTGEPFYVGSVSGKYTPQEIAAYFTLD